MMTEGTQANASGLVDTMQAMGQRARRAARLLTIVPSAQKNGGLEAMADAVAARSDTILAANAEDIHNGKAKGLSAAFLDRLLLTQERIEAMIKGIRTIAALPDPVGQVMAQWERPNGLRIARVRTPLGVIGVIYESRPNVTADAGALCIKAGNAVILRSGSDALNSAMAIANALRSRLDEAGLPRDALQLVETDDRAAVGAMLSGLSGTLDVIVPRGGKSLVARVQREARVPVFAHLEGICHVYIHKDANPHMAQAITLNAKMRRTGICGAAETLLVDENFPQAATVELLDALKAAGCEVRADAAIKKFWPSAFAATQEDWNTEYLDAIIAVKQVAGIGEAIAHIASHGSAHTESIVTEDDAAAAQFMQEVDSAIVMHNASTQFADGGEFGMGAEIGIATGRMHARGPVGVEQLTSFKYQVYGHGQVRP